MSRHKKNSDDDISLFPFLSIIASVIGVLTMMIATLALAQTDTPDVAMIEEFEQKQKEIKIADQAIEDLRKEISVNHSTALQLRDQKKQLDMTADELEFLLKEIEEVDKALAEQKQVQIVIPEIDETMRETATDMQTQADELKEQVAQLEKELSLRTESSEANVTVLPQGSGLNFKPHFVECAADSIVLHTMSPPPRIRIAEMTKDDRLLDLLAEVANGTNDSIVLLVRSDALGTFNRVKQLCDERGIRNGKLPVVGQGRIDLEAFTK